MKFYLAARYSKIAKMQKVRNELNEYGHVVTSQWILGKHQASDDGLTCTAKDAECIRFAIEDIYDIMRADAIVCFTETPRAGTSRGGRHVEAGSAMALNKLVFVVGPKENVFYTIPETIYCEDYLDFKLKIGIGRLWKHGT